VLTSVDHVHQRVHGALPEDAGPFPAGTPYSAFDPDLMLWTVAVMMDSAQCFYELFLRRLSEPEREGLWQDYVRFGELFGMPRDAAPRSYPDFRAYWDERMASDELHLTDEARYMGYAVAFEIPLPAHLQPAKRVHDLVMLGSLPPRVREIYGLPWTRVHAVAFRAAVAAIRVGRVPAPAAVSRGGTRARSRWWRARSESGSRPVGPRRRSPPEPTGHPVIRPRRRTAPAPRALRRRWGRRGRTAGCRSPGRAAGAPTRAGRA
jgi:uncharacterized protein (DUF2236 family)